MTNQNGRFAVLGATGSVGYRLACQLVAAGHDVTIGGRNADKLAAIGQELGCATHEVTAGDAASIDACLKAAAGDGKLNGVANCIGSVLLKPAHLISDEEWFETLQVNLFSSFAVVRSAAKLMRSAGGSVVLVSSAAAQIGLANHEAIAAAKAGILGLARSASATYAGRGIRFNCVSPGLVKSEMTKKLWETESAAEMSAGMHALGRLGEPNDIASAISFLLDPANNWITGQCLGVDGGLGSILSRMKM
ncbi:MAG: SDR family oxidoreductase [Fuerstiella sp.]